MSKLLTTAQAAEYLGCSQSTIIKAHKSGTLIMSGRNGKNFMWHKRDLNALIAAKRKREADKKKTSDWSAGRVKPVCSVVVERKPVRRRINGKACLFIAGASSPEFAFDWAGSVGK